MQQPGGPTASSCPTQPSLLEQLGDFFSAQALAYMAALQLLVTSAGLPARQTSCPWHQVGNSKLRAGSEELFSSTFPLQHKPLSQSLSFSPKSSQWRGTPQIMYFCAQCCVAQRFLPKHQLESPWLHPALLGAALSKLYFCIHFTSRLWKPKERLQAVLIDVPWSTELPRELNSCLLSQLPPIRQHNPRVGLIIKLLISAET